MNQQEIFNCLWKITKERYDAYRAKVECMGKDHPTERAALQLTAGIYNVALAAGLISGSSNATELMSTRFPKIIKHFPALANRYHSLPQSEKECMEIALYPETFMRINFYQTYVNDLESAQKEGDPQKIFKAKIKKEVLEDILHMWETFRLQNDLFIFPLSDTEK